MIRKDNWSHWEDETITDVMLEYAKQKKKATHAFAYLASILPIRTASAVSYQWYTNLRPKVLMTEEENIADEALEESPILPLDTYTKLLEAPNLTQETIELINLRIRSLI
jgi:hypothetical protein